MTEIIEFFREGGAVMFFIVPLGLTVIGLSIAAIFVSATGLRYAALGAAFLPLLVGLGGMQLGRIQVERAIVMVEPSMRDELRAVGMAEAARPVQLGGGFTVVALIPALAALVRGSKK